MVWEDMLNSFVSSSWFYIPGTSRFKVPIEMLSKKVEELNELRVEKLNRVKLVEKEKDELEGPMKNALGFLRMENEKVDKTFRQRSRFANI